jgi:hypothetical protein
MKQFEKIRPEIINTFEKHPNFYKTYIVENKLHIAFSDLIMGITPVGWDIYFVEIMHRLAPGQTQLAYAKVCKNKEIMMQTLKKARETYKKPEPTSSKERIGFAVDINQLLNERLKKHEKFIRVFAGYEKLFLVFEDILILIEPIGGSFYNWELFERVGDVEVKHAESGAMVGFDKLVEAIMELREKYDKIQNYLDSHVSDLQNS